MKCSGMLITTCMLLFSCLKTGGSPALLYAPLCPIHQSKLLTQKQMFCSNPQRMRNSAHSYPRSCGDQVGPAGELGCGSGKGADKRLSPGFLPQTSGSGMSWAPRRLCFLVTKTRGAGPTSQGDSEKLTCEDSSGH